MSYIIQNCDKYNEVSAKPSTGSSLKTYTTLSCNVLQYNLSTDQREINKQTTNPSSTDPIYVYTNTSTYIRVFAIYNTRHSDVGMPS